jgi:hypothetical protein
MRSVESRSNTRGIQTAISDYQNVKKPTKPQQIPAFSYKLAQMRLAAVGSKEHTRAK